MTTTQLNPAAPSAPSAPVWRQFLFFDVSPIKGVHDPSNPPETFSKSTAEISTIVSTPNSVLVADIYGSVIILDRDFESVQSWIAYPSGRATHMIEKQRILVTLGEEENVRSPMLKIWNMDKLDPKTGKPHLLRSAKVHQSNRPHPATTMALSSTLSHLAIGLADGTVLLYRHLDQFIFSGSHALASLPKSRVVHESPTEPITGLGFKEPSAEDTDNTNLYLFVVTTNHVLSYQTTGKGSGNAATAVVVDEVGSALGCATMDWKVKDMVVAKDEALYIIGTEGRGACYAYEGHKSSVHTHLNYLIMVSPPFTPKASSASATVRNFVAQNTRDTDITKLTVFDLENKFVAYTGTFIQGVRAVFSAWGNIFILGNDGSLSCLKEKPTSEKLDMLYRKSLYLLALNLAKTQKLDQSHVADIYRQYGDHLYAKGDYDGAMQQYVQTIGHLQPSYVIRKFLDAQRIHNLVMYLQELHSLGLANSDHTTLLLNTYTKLKDVARLDSFIKTEGSVRSNDDGSETKELPFDLDTAIRVCRQAGYFEHASYLAKKYERHEDYLRIQIEDAEKYAEALAYLRKLGAAAAESNLARYGRAMLSSLPEETTQLLIDLCTSSGPLINESADSAALPVAKQASNAPSYLSYLALNRATPAPPTVTSDSATPTSPSIKTLRPGDTTSRLDSTQEDRSSSPPPSANVSSSPAPKLHSTSPPPVKLPSPKLYFAHFVDHMDQFVVFLETVARRRWGQTVDGDIADRGGLPVPADEEADKQDQMMVWNTLLELYLTLPNAEKDAALKDKAQKVLKSSTIPYDPTHALILCSSHGYTSGLVLLWEKMGMYEDVLRFWMDRDRDDPASDASNEVIRYLNLYGPPHPHLYPLVLRYLTSTPELLTKHLEDVKQILHHINTRGIMPPARIVQMLSRNEVASVGLVKEWLMGRIQESKEEIANDQLLITTYRLETTKKLMQVGELENPDKPRIFHSARCSSCGGQLDLPTVHFMCDHSYHQRCLVDQETECPVCAREHAVIREIRMSNERLSDQHELFLAQVQENGLSAVASAFSRGLLNNPRLENFSMA